MGSRSVLVLLLVDSAWHWFAAGVLLLSPLNSPNEQFLSLHFPTKAYNENVLLLERGKVFKTKLIH